MIKKQHLIRKSKKEQVLDALRIIIQEKMLLSSDHLNINAMISCKIFVSSFITLLFGTHGTIHANHFRPRWCQTDVMTEI